MDEYFIILKKMSTLSNKEYDSILELTRDIAIGAGYHRGDYILKNV